MKSSIPRAERENLAGKIKAKGVVPHAEGPTQILNDDAKFVNKGKTEGKIMTQKTVVDGSPHGTTFTENSTHIPTMNADKKPPATKIKDSTKWLDPHASKPTSSEDKPVQTTRGYELKRSYEK